MKLIRKLFTYIILLTAFTSTVAAQNPVRPVPDTSAVAVIDTTLQVPTALPDLDSVQVPVWVQGTDTTNTLPIEEEGPLETGKSILERPAFSSARDSVIEDLSGPHKMIYYYGDVFVEYGDISLKADYMEYDVDANTVFARGSRDFDGTLKGTPEMTNEGITYKMEEVTYNFTSHKAKIKNMTTHIEEGELRGENLKMLEDQSVNIVGGQYTVCDADHPHYYLQMTAAKVMTQPNKKTVFGPAYLVIEDVPLPIALPFGFVPEFPTRASGIMMPTYGEETSRGLYLRDLGYYFVLGDHFDVSVTGDIYSYGSWALDLNTRYKKRYSFDGSIGLGYSVDIVGARGTSEYSESRNFSVRWSHAMDSKAIPGTTFRASVNFSSPRNNVYNSRSIDDAIQNQISSSISFSKTLPFGSISINALHSQNSRDSSYSFTLPNITFSVNRFYPFKNKHRVGKELFYEKISFSYSTTLQNRISFKAREFGQEGFLDKFNNGMTHSFNIGLPSFTLFKYLQFSPNISYGMNWFFRENIRSYDPEADKVISQMTGQFSTFGVTQSFSAGLSMSTRIYGTFNFNPKRKLQAIRHMITPSVSFSFRPEMGTPANGWTTLTYTNKAGETITQEYNKYSGMIYSPPSKGRSASVGFSIGNNLEAKIRDTTGVGTQKVKLIDQLTISGSYNFLADSLKLSTINISANTTIFGKLSIHGSMLLDPYAIDGEGRRINKLQVIKDGRLGRITNASASLSYSLSGKGAVSGNDGRKENGAVLSSTVGSDYYRVYYHPVTGEYIPGGWLYYTNLSVPWYINLNYNFSYTSSYRKENDELKKINTITQTFSLSGRLRLTKALNITLNTGYDITRKKLTTTQLSASYDLHCFNISFSWIPSGTWSSWSFRIAANASALADLLQYNKNSSYWDNSQGGSGWAH
ncbi:MAG: LPS-assembly protein LptD [Bacteroidales bacterium]|nr:LPS-assembly protein LptD [Bacteroidales bacterium]